MTTIRVSRCHPLGLAAARAEIERVALRVRDSHGAQFVWCGDTLVFRHTGVSGQISVGPERVDLDLRLGILLAPMRARIEARLVEKIDRALARRLAELLPAVGAAGLSGVGEVRARGRPTVAGTAHACDRHPPSAELEICDGSD